MEGRLENVLGENLFHLKGKAVSKQDGQIKYIDMSQVQYITSSDIAELITIVKMGISQGNEVRLFNVKENVQRFINKMGLQSILVVENMVN